MSQPFPFSALVGQDHTKLALLATAVDPGIGGVLIFGDRGTGKSTAVRGLASLLPPIATVKKCQYHCSEEEVGDCPCSVCASSTKQVKLVKKQVPVIDLPLGVTEDRVVGAFDIEHALNTGEKKFQPGLLADAHRGFLYVDEVNLLEDHIVDVLLDVAASGVNVVERDGISIRHPSKFVLIGSGNPEEGELRPQLLDRFGLSVEVSTPENIKDRMAVVRRRDQFDANPVEFANAWAKEDKKIQRRVATARKRLLQVTVGDEIRETVSELCVQLKTDGLRGDLTLLKTARAVAAIEGSPSVDTKHIAKVAGMALRHRLRRDPLDESGSTVRVERAVSSLLDANAA